MKRKLLALLPLLIFFSLNIFSQENNDAKKILESVWNKQHEVNVVPDDALSGNYDVLLYPYILREKEGVIYALEVSWESGSVDGRYIMEITPLQILLYSQHDNPNSNYLYWMSNLKDGEYQLIKDHLEKLISNESDILTDTYSGKLNFTYNWLFSDPVILHRDKIIGVRDHTAYEQMYGQIVKDHLYLNTFILVTEINECLKERYISFPEKEEFFVSKIIRLINDDSELVKD